MGNVNFQIEKNIQKLRIYKEIHMQGVSFMKHSSEFREFQGNIGKGRWIQGI